MKNQENPIENSGLTYTDAEGEIFAAGEEVVVTGGPDNKLRRGLIETIAKDTDGKMVVTIRTVGGEFAFRAGDYNLDKKKNW